MRSFCITHIGQPSQGERTFPFGRPWVCGTFSNSFATLSFYLLFLDRTLLYLGYLEIILLEASRILQDENKCGTSMDWLGPSCISDFEDISSCASSLPILDCLWQFLGNSLALSVEIIWIQQDKCWPLFLDVQHVRAPTWLCVCGPVDRRLLVSALS